MRYYLYLLLTGLLFSSSCRVQKNRATAQQPVHINLNTVRIGTGQKAIEIERTFPDKKIDILHTDLSVSFDWDKHFCFGKENIFFTPFNSSIDSFELDAKQMEIETVTLSQGRTNIPVHYTYTNSKLKIHPEILLNPTDSFDLHIQYTAKPDSKEMNGSSAIRGDKGLYFINTDHKEPYKPIQLWTQGETEANSNWFVTIDHPNEKSTFDIHITVADSMTVLSNGEHLSMSNLDNGMKTENWKVHQPMSAYLVMMAIGNFKITSDSWEGKKVDYYLEPKFHPYAKAIFKHTSEMMTFFSKKLGTPYPWEKYSQVVVHDYVSGAMENTSATLHGAFVQKNYRSLIGNSNDGIIAHELFHQWFGDLVTCASWSHLTLNEGFASFGEQLWEEYKYGEDAALKKVYNSMNSYLRFSKFDDGPLIRFFYTDKEDMFNSITYQKGSRVLNLLRFTLGEDVFFKGIKNYLSHYSFQNAQIEDLKKEMETVSGKDLRPFFNQWYMRGGHPKVEISYNINEANKATINVNQTQGDTLFQFPLQIAMVQDGKRQLFTFQCKDKNELFSIPESVTGNTHFYADPNGLVIGELIENIDSLNLKNRFSWASNYIEKIRILDNLLKYQISETDKEALILLALKDHNPAISTKAMTLINTKNTDLLILIRNTLIEIASLSSNTDQKTTAISLLIKVNDLELINQLTEWSVDSSYSVSAMALQGLVNLLPEVGLRQAEKLEKEAAGPLLHKIADIYAEYGDSSKTSYFTSNIPQNFNNDRAILIQAYGQYALRNLQDHSFWPFISYYAKEDDNERCRYEAIFALKKYADKKNDEQLKDAWDTLVKNEKSGFILKTLKINKMILDDK